VEAHKKDAHFAHAYKVALLTPVCLSPGNITWYRSKAGDALRLGMWP